MVVRPSCDLSVEDMSDQEELARRQSLNRQSSQNENLPSVDYNASPFKNN